MLADWLPPCWFGGWLADMCHDSQWLGWLKHAMLVAGLAGLSILVGWLVAWLAWLAWLASLAWLAWLGWLYPG